MGLLNYLLLNGMRKFYLNKNREEIILLKIVMMHQLTQEIEGERASMKETDALPLCEFINNNYTINADVRNVF